MDQILYLNQYIKLLEERLKHEEEISKKAIDLVRSMVGNLNNQSNSSTGCSVCGVGSNTGTIGYVCTRGDCPTKISC